MASLSPTYFPASHLSRPITFPSPRSLPSRRRWRSPSSSLPRSSLADEQAMGVDTLRQFVLQNLGVWNGCLYQFDAAGNLLQNVSTRLSARSYGEGDLLSLIQTLYIKQAPSKTLTDCDDEPEWVEYKIKETNMFTVDKYQQIGYFSNERAFSLRYQTAGMLEMVLRAGVLGEDDTGEESPRNLRLPSRRPSVVCENCLYSVEENSRARAFHILDPKGTLEMVFIFLEQLGEGVNHIPSPYSAENKDDTNRLKCLLGHWKGHSITKRSGVYGATIAEAETSASIEIDNNGQLIQDISSRLSGSNTTTNVRWSGQVSGNMISFDGGFQMTLLDGGMYVGCPSDVSKSVAQSQSFHLEFGWMESPNKRQRLVRTYDFEGLVVSSTYFCETKV